MIAVITALATRRRMTAALVALASAPSRFGWTMTMSLLSELEDSIERQCKRGARGLAANRTFPFGWVFQASAWRLDSRGLQAGVVELVDTMRLGRIAL